MPLEKKFVVVKQEDIEPALGAYQTGIFLLMLATIQEYRTFHGKKQNNYVVINQDEPYFSEVLKLMGIEE